MTCTWGTDDKIPSRESGLAKLGGSKALSEMICPCPLPPPLLLLTGGLFFWTFFMHGFHRGLRVLVFGFPHPNIFCPVHSSIPASPVPTYGSHFLLSVPFISLRSPRHSLQRSKRASDPSHCRICHRFPSP